MRGRPSAGEGVAHRAELAPGVEAVLVTGYDAALEVQRSPHFAELEWRPGPFHRASPHSR